MDLTSEITGVIAFGVQVLHLLYELATTVKELPGDVDELKREAQDTTIALQGLERILEQHALVPLYTPDAERIRNLLRTVEPQLREINSFVSDAQRYSGRTQGVRVFMKRGKLQKLQNTLITIKGTITQVVAISTSQCVGHVTRVLTTHVASVETEIIFSRNHREWQTVQMQQLHTVLAALEHRLWHISRMHEGAFERVFHMPTLAETIQPPPPALIISTRDRGIPRSHPSPHSPYSPIRRIRKLECMDDCPCRCHHPSLVNVTPSWLSGLVGNFFVPPGFISWMCCNWTRLKKCDDPGCQMTALFVFQVKWFLPTWFVYVEKMIQLSVFPVDFRIQTPRVVEWSSPILSSVWKMDINAVDLLLKSGQATINDVNPHGDGLLHIAAFSAVEHDSFESVCEMFQYLINQGVHPEWQNHTHKETPLESLIHWEFNRELRPRGIPSERSHPVQVGIIGPCFNQDISDILADYIAKKKFNDAHRAVLGIGSSPLTTVRERLAKVDTALLSGKAANGWTPLEWGIHCSIPGIVEAMQELGVDLHEGYPLHTAAISGNADAACALITRAGIDVDTLDPDGRTPLHAAAWQGQYVVAEALLRVAGNVVDWDARCNGLTALDIAERNIREFEEWDMPSYASLAQMLSTRTPVPAAELVNFGRCRFRRR